jgi:hypothetical protein
VRHPTATLTLLCQQLEQTFELAPAGTVCQERSRVMQSRLRAASRGRAPLQIDKSAILELLRERGQDDQAGQAGQELPDQVDTDQHADLLQRFGLDPQDLLQRFMGGGMPSL